MLKTCMETTRRKKYTTDLWWVPRNQQRRKGIVTAWQTRSAKKQAEILRSCTLSDSPETGRNTRIPRLIKPVWGFYATGKLLCIPKAAVFSIPMPLLHMVSCKTGSVCETLSFVSTLQMLSSRLSLPRMTGVLYKLQRGWETINHTLWKYCNNQWPGKTDSWPGKMDSWRGRHVEIGLSFARWVETDWDAC